MLRPPCFDPATTSTNSPKPQKATTAVVDANDAATDEARGAWREVEGVVHEVVFASPQGTLQGRFFGAGGVDCSRPIRGGPVCQKRAVC